LPTITEQQVSLACDVNFDSACDGLDYDAVAAAIHAGDTSPKFDLNRDFIVSHNERVYWVNDLMATVFGDSNLDGSFNSLDLVAVLQAGKFQTDSEAGWAEGDWNGDELFNTVDIVTVLQAGTYEPAGAGAGAALKPGGDALAAVPEPSSLVLAGISFLALVVCVYRQRAIGWRVGGRSGG
jgi:hypothetical protein